MYPVLRFIFSNIIRIMHKYILLLSFFLILSPIIAAQENKSDSLKSYQRFDVSYVFGGQIYNNNFIYNPGFALQASCGMMLNEMVGVGLGLGYNSLHDEKFLPVFIEAIGYFKEKTNTPVVKMQIGYSFGWYTGTMEVEGYKFHGGICLDAGLGRKIQINPRNSVFFHLSYRHQFARMEYKIFGEQQYSERMNYDMLIISLGLIRH